MRGILTINDQILSEAAELFIEQRLPELLAKWTDQAVAERIRALYPPEKQAMAEELVEAWHKSFLEATSVEEF